MKKLLLAATALLGFVGAATAADLAPRFVPALLSLNHAPTLAPT